MSPAPHPEHGPEDLCAERAALYERALWQGHINGQEAAQQPSVGAVTPRQHAIAALLVEGHTDAVITERLGMNVRTAREHIAELAATLGSANRAQLGYLIARSGILDRER